MPHWFEDDAPPTDRTPLTRPSGALDGAPAADVVDAHGVQL